MASNLEELVQHFDMKMTRLKGCMELRGLDTNDDTGTVDLLQSINNEVTEIEGLLSDFKEYLSNQKELLQKAESLKEFVEMYEKRTKHIADNLPEHLPGRKSVDSRKVLKEKTNQEPEQKGKKPKSATGASYHKISYLTTDEFEGVPKYLKGRLTYQQVNSAIDQIHKVLAAKYKILSSSRAGMSEIVMRKYRVFREQESAETKGCYFFIDKDIKEYSTFKLDKSGQSILSILRHCGKLKEVRSGKLVRFVVLP